MKLQISNGVQKFIFILSSVFLILLFWLIFMVGFFELSFVNYILVGLFVLVCIDFALFKLFKTHRVLIIVAGVILVVGFTWYFYKEASDCATATIEVGDFIKIDRENYLLFAPRLIKSAYDDNFRNIVIADSLIVVVLAIVWHLSYWIPSRRKNNKQ